MFLYIKLDVNNNVYEYVQVDQLVRYIYIRHIAVIL